MPLPLNQKTKRGGTKPAAAYAVPFELNMAASGGSPTRIAAPVMLIVLRSRRLLSGIGCLLWRGPFPPPLKLRRTRHSLGDGGQARGSAALKGPPYGAGVTPSRNCGERTSATSSSLNVNPESRNAVNAVLTVSRSAPDSTRPNA